MSNINYENDLRIDHSALDIEWLDQPSLLMKYVGFVAKAEKTLEQLRRKEGIVKAGLDKDVREDPESFGITAPKLTEPMVSAAILLAPAYKKIAKQIIEATCEGRMLKGAVNAIEHKKRALENLVTLHGQKYFAGPHIPRKLAEEVANKRAAAEKANESITFKRKK